MREHALLLPRHENLHCTGKGKVLKGELLDRGERSREGGCAYPFERALAREGISLICEVKKASPSKGLIAPDFPYLDIARAYEQGGASAVSVLTEPHYFLGKNEYAQEIAQAVDLPVLRKDFVVDPYQIYEAKILGVSAVLLIVMLLDDSQLHEYIDLAHSLGLSALVEAHSEEEIARALQAGARVIGVNNRDLRTFHVDMENTMRLRELVPPDVLFVAESGVHDYSDVRTLMQCNVDAVLIGEALMRACDKAQAVRELRGA